MDFASLTHLPPFALIGLAVVALLGLAFVGVGVHWFFDKQDPSPLLALRTLSLGLLLATVAVAASFLLANSAQANDDRKERLAERSGVDESDLPQRLPNEGREFTATVDGQERTCLTAENYTVLLCVGLEEVVISE